MLTGRRQTDDPGLLKVPDGHDIQEVLPGGLYVLTGHFRQVDTPVAVTAVLYEPPGQGIAPPPALVFGPTE